MASSRLGWAHSRSKTGLMGQESEHVAGPSDSKASGWSTEHLQASKGPEKASKASQRADNQRHKAIEHTIQKAQKEAAKQNKSPQGEEPSGTQITPPRQLQLPVILEELPPAAWSPDEGTEQVSLLPSTNKLLFGTRPDSDLPELAWEHPVECRVTSAEATFTPTAAGLRLD